MATLFIFLLFFSSQKGPPISFAIDMNNQTDPSFQFLKNFVPEVEIIWGDEDNDWKLSLKYIKYKDRVLYR